MEATTTIRRRSKVGLDDMLKQQIRDRAPDLKKK
jgi:hypothetical protein